MRGFEGPGFREFGEFLKDACKLVGQSQGARCVQAK